MSKENKDSTEKKKIKKEKVDDENGSPTKKAKETQAEIQKPSAQFLFELEEKSAEGRVLADDVQMFRKSCDKLRSVMEQIAQLKTDAGGNSAEKIAALRKLGILEFVVLKRMNRMARFSCKAVREVTHEAKQKLDTHHLRLQNLLYEIMHLQREISKCLDFKSNDEDIELVEVEEFYASAPETIAKPEMTRTDLHQQTLARLDWELEQRKRLADQLKESQSSKGGLKKEIDSKRNYLQSLKPKLNDILQSTKPVQEHLNMPFDEMREQHKSATFLPRPLYVLYMQATAYRHACDSHLTVSIQGDVESVKCLGQTENSQDEDSDSENEEAGGSGGQEDNKKRRRHTTRGKSEAKEVPASTASADKHTRVLATHPLTVKVTVKCKDGSCIELVFTYLLVLEIVTVQVQLTTLTDAPTALGTNGDLVSADSVLSCLYPGDVGSSSPNSANAYLLQRAGISRLSDFASRIGLPYRWVQSVCGLRFLSGLSSAPPSAVTTSVATNAAAAFEDTEATLGTVVRRARRRVRARLALARQLGAFEKCSLAVAPEYLHLFPTKISAQLTSWKRITHEDYSSLAYTQHVVTSSVLREQHLSFTAVISRGSAKLSVAVLVSEDYPLEPPLFALSLLWKRTRTAANDENIREMEREVNVQWRELAGVTGRGEQLLSCQLARLAMCLDVYLESEAPPPEEGPNEFAKERIVTKAARGRQRTKPFKFNSQLGIFQQR